LTQRTLMLKISDYSFSFDSVVSCSGGQGFFPSNIFIYFSFLFILSSFFSSFYFSFLPPSSVFSLIFSASFLCLFCSLCSLLSHGCSLALDPSYLKLFLLFCSPLLFPFYSSPSGFILCFPFIRALSVLLVNSVLIFLYF
jgi:hypothetical protein